MMRTIQTENKRKILQNKNLIEKKLGIEISERKFERGKNIVISGDELQEHISEKVFDAIDIGFSVNDALLLSDEEYVFEKLNIKHIAKRKNFREVRGRVIGTLGRTLKTIYDLSDCKIVLHDNKIGIIGRAEDMKFALNALHSLIKGNKHANVYKYLEKSRKLTKREFSDDFMTSEIL